MNRVTLQIPVDKSLKVSAEKVAIEQGFSSLQEALRVFMKQFASKHLTIEFSHKIDDEILTTKQEIILNKKTEKVKNEIKNGKGFVAHSVDEMMSQLRS